MHAAFRKSGALRKAPDALLPMFTNRVENANTFGPQSHRVGPCSEGWLKSWRKSALQSTRSTTGCPALGEYSVRPVRVPTLFRKVDRLSLVHRAGQRGRNQNLPYQSACSMRYDPGSAVTIQAVRGRTGVPGWLAVPTSFETVLRPGP